MKTYNLIDYKGKSDIIMDKGLEDVFDYIIGEITHEEVIKQSKRRIENSLHYGIPTYVGSDEELKKIFG
jgi:hypothetical protein